MYGDFCPECQECPMQREYSIFAISSNCSKGSNQFCPKYLESSKIYMNKINASITEYCPYGGNEIWECPKANKGLDFDQCFNM